MGGGCLFSLQSRTYAKALFFCQVLEIKQILPLRCAGRPRRLSRPSTQSACPLIAMAIEFGVQNTCCLNASASLDAMPRIHVDGWRRNSFAR
jgi:hypothetical protein